jgi:outer membrane lipoprotein-sorting protein
MEGMSRTLRHLLLLFPAAVTLSATTLEEVIDRARSFVGPEGKLEAVESLAYRGTLTPAGDGEPREVRLLLEKPANQRLEIEQGNGRVTMIVNPLEGFMVEENLESGQRRIIPLPTDQVRRFKANATENLYFFRFPADRQVRAKYMGEEEFRGETVDAVRFIHPGGIRFFRYFDPETGELVGTRTDTGTVNTEEGRMEVDGLVFSERVLSYEDGELIHTIEFSEIEVNPGFGEGTFRAE